jgi:hypothetical protein
MNAWILRNRYPNAMRMLSPADNFFFAHFSSLRRERNIKKVVELWDTVKRGDLTIDEANTLVPVERYYYGPPIEVYQIRHGKTILA